MVNNASYNSQPSILYGETKGDTYKHQYLGDTYKHQYLGDTYKHQYLGDTYKHQYLTANIHSPHNKLLKMCHRTVLVYVDQRFTPEWAV